MYDHSDEYPPGKEKIYMYISNNANLAQWKRLYKQ